ncbi:MAG: M14 family zinc carboxypeptidase [bacterium]|nr:M14 family zinc carboxypeptidase [bacterium]
MKFVLAVPKFRFLYVFYVIVFYSLTFAGGVGSTMEGAKLFRFPAEHKAIQRLECDHPGVIVDELTRYNEAYVWATPQGVASLTSAGHPVEPVIDETDWWTQYPTYRQVTDSLVALAARHPTVAKIDTIGYSFNRHPLVAITISNQITAPDVGNKPGIMLIGAIHGNEKPGTVLLMNFAEWLLDSVNVDGRMVWLRQYCRFQILPIFNPDGYLTNNRMNGHSVDLNRNYPDKTSNDSNDVTTGREPETQAMMNWTRQTKPMLAIDFHDGITAAVYPNFADIDVGANASFPPQPDRKWYTAAADSYAVYNPPMWNSNTPPLVNGTVNAVQLYQAHNSLPDYHYYYHWCRHITVELANEHTPAPEWLPTMWETNKNSILAFSSLIQQGVELTLVGLVPSDSAIADLNWGYPRYVKNGTLNSWRFLLPPGEYYPRIFDSHTHSTYRQDGPISQYYPSTVLVSPNFLRPISGNLFPSYRNWETTFPIGPSYRLDSLRVALDSLSLSPLDDYPLIWHGVTLGTYATLSLRPVPDAMPLLLERRWLLWDHRPDGVYLPVKFMRDNFNPPLRRDNRLHIDTSIAYTSDGTYGTGTALQFTANGRQGGGLTDSPTGNYENNVNSEFTFGRFILNEVRWDSAHSPTLSFTYRGNMETWADYWAISYSIDDIAYLPLDTLTGVVPAWRLYQKDIPLIDIPLLSTSLYLKITVHTDESDARDGYTMDDLAVTHWGYEWVDAPEEIVTIPQRFSLSTAPNPFNAISNITVTLPRDGIASVVVYDVTGRMVETLQQGRMAAGSHTMRWNAQAYSSGVYFIRASSLNEVRTTKVVLLK